MWHKQTVAHVTIATAKDYTASDNHPQQTPQWQKSNSSYSGDTLPTLCWRYLQILQNSSFKWHISFTFPSSQPPSLQGKTVAGGWNLKCELCTHLAKVCSLMWCDSGNVASRQGASDTPTHRMPIGRIQKREFLFIASNIVKKFNMLSALAWKMSLVSLHETPYISIVGSFFLISVFVIC